MEVEKLYIKRIENGKEVFFPSSDNPAIIGQFTYTAKRMGSAPTLTCTLMYYRCLDNEWTKKEYVTFMGEKYFVLQVPTSSKQNEDVGYKHEITFVSERIALENVYFLDVVTATSANQDRYRSNNTNVSFYGDVNELVTRLNDSMLYSNLNNSNNNGYHIVVDVGITSEIKEISFDSKYLSEAIQEIYNTYNLTYYFEGKIIHVGKYQNLVNDINSPLKYGQGNGLLSITKTNSNFKTINRITGVGSSDNIPFYYPNDTEKGIVIAKAGTSNKGIKDSGISIIDKDLFASNVLLYPYLEYHIGNISNIKYYSDNGTITTYTPDIYGIIKQKFEEKSITVSPQAVDGIKPSGDITYSGSNYRCELTINNDFDLSDDSTIDIKLYVGVNGVKKDVSYISKIVLVRDEINEVYSIGGSKITENITVSNLLKGKYSLKVSYTFNSNTTGEMGITLSTSGIWEQNGVVKDLATCGLSISGNPQLGDVIIQEKKDWIEPTQNLMPSIYKSSIGKERFYNAVNNTYLLPDSTDQYYSFSNPWTEDNIKEYKKDDNTIKPSIKNVKNSSGQLIGIIEDIAYDTDSNGNVIDSDEKNSDGNYVHPYYYIKLRKFDGNFGFNLFDQANETDYAKITLTSGNCSSCTFEIVVTKTQIGNVYKFNNPIQVDSKGVIVNGNYTAKIVTNNLIASQQNTSTNEVWIALKKENSTFGIIMPNASSNYKPSIGDSFVLSGIKMPIIYIKDAEKKLDEYLIKYLSDNNSEHFNFSINFSRIYLEEYPLVYDNINENALIYIEYNSVIYPLYISTFTYKSDGNILPSIEVELAGNLEVSQSVLQSQLSEVKNELYTAINSINPIAVYDKFYVRKDRDDVVEGKLTHIKRDVFNNGFQIGETFQSGILGGKGGNIDENANAELESLKVRSFIEAPEYRFNKVDVVAGELWNSICFGTIESVTINYDSNGNDLKTGTIKLKLEEGEYSGIEVGDICRGIFHNLAASASIVDSSGFTTISGFSTAYFQVTSVDNSDSFGGTFNYSLKSDTSFHPCAYMKFSVYGSTINSARRSSAYHTRTYTRYLCDVKTFEITAFNIYMQIGNLDGLNINGVAMSGYGTYQKNVYMYGAIMQFSDDKQKEQVLSQLYGYEVNLSKSEGVLHIPATTTTISSTELTAEDYVTATIESTDSNGNIIYSDVLVTVNDNGTEKQVIVNGYALITEVSVIKAKGKLEYTASTPTTGYYSISLEVHGLTAYVDRGNVIIGGVDLATTTHYIKISVNCEANSVITKEYFVTIVKDGKEGISYLGSDEYYQYSNSGTIPPTGTWTKNVVPTQPADTSYRFLWNYELISKSDGTSVETAKHVIGSEGKGIQSVVEYYALTSQSSEPSSDSILWDKTKKVPTISLPYLWNKEVVIYNDNTTQTNIHILAQRGADGTNGTDAEFYQLESDSDTMTVSTQHILSPTSNSITLYHIVGGAKSVYSNSYLAMFVVSSEDNYTMIGNVQQRSSLSITSSTASLTVGNKAIVVVSINLASGVNSSQITTWENINDNTLCAWIAQKRINYVYSVLGPAGDVGPMFRPCGYYDDTVTYIRNTSFVDYVFYGTTKPMIYYVKEGISSVIGQTPSDSSSYWTLANNMKAIATDVLLANFANIAGAIFYNNMLMSQQGVDENGVSTENYTGYSSGTFKPNVLIDWKNGVITSAYNKNQTAVVTPNATTYTYHIGGICKDGYSPDPSPIYSLNLLITSTTQVANNTTVFLPVDEKFIGARVVITNAYVEQGVIGTNSGVLTTITVGGSVVNGLVTPSDSNKVNTLLGVMKSSDNSQVATKIIMKNGTIELLGINTNQSASFNPSVIGGSNVTETMCQWAVVGIQCNYISIE